MSDRPAPRTRADYRNFQEIATRWSDNDGFGHLYNVAYLHLFDEAMNRWMAPHGLLDPRAPNGVIAYVVENGCLYFRETAYPVVARIGLAVTAIGRSSARMEFGMFTPDAETEAARGHFALVCVGTGDRRPTPWPEAQRAALETLRVG